MHLDGISLDIEHGATANVPYVSLLKELGKYFGPLSPDSTSQMYIAAIYTGGAPGPAIGKSKEITALHELHHGHGVFFLELCQPL